ncbi:MAG: hypothetical protein Q8R26_00020 [bacterium]|nr:hypothetical protein [bacterium]
MNKEKYMVIRDIGIIAISVLVTIDLVQSGVIDKLITNSLEFKLIGTFVAGILFTSIFTTVPATVALAQITQHNSLFLVATIGACGALIGDLIIFRFVKDSIGQDIAYLIGTQKKKRLLHIFHLKVFRWLIPFLGAIILASPLPDELGIMMMGLTKLRATVFIPISLAFNFIGILIIGAIARL